MLLSTRAKLAALLLSGVALPLAALPVGAASLTRLQPLVAGGTSRVMAMSGDGQVSVGISDNMNGDIGAAIWGLGAAAQDQGAWIINATTPGTGTAISNNGLHYLAVDSADMIRAIRGGSGYGVLGADGTANHQFYGTGISDDGDLVVGREDTHAAFWTWSGAAYNDAQWMASLGGGNDSALALTPDGTLAVGSSQDGSGDTRAVVWSGAAFSTIQALDTGLYDGSTAFAISDDGSTVVGYVIDSGTTKAAIWNGAGYADTNVVAPIGASYSEFTAVSADGSVAGGTFETEPFVTHTYAFLYSNGEAGNLNTMLSNAGVDMTGIQLTTVAGLSDDGQFIATNAGASGDSYIAFYDGIIGGLTTSSAQVASADPVLAQRQAVATQPDLYAGIIAGDLQPADGSSEVGAFGLYGSAVGGARATGVIDANWSVSGGLSLGTGDYGALAYQGVMAASVVRYDADPFANGVNLFGQAGGSFGLLDPLTFRRDYANGAGTATGIGVTSGHVASLFARIGLRGDVSETDQLSAAAEIGQRWLATAAYAETASAGNPFPASFGAATDTATIGKLAATWTHQFTPELDMTLRGAVGMSLAGSTDLKMTATGAGVVQPDYVGDRWVEGGLRLGWKATETTRLDLYATGMAGSRVGLAGHVGAGLSLGF